MTLSGKEDADPLYIVGENATGAVSLANADGAAIAELDTRWNQVCTVAQFWWDDKSYRYTCVAHNSLEACSHHSVVPTEFTTMWHTQGRDRCALLPNGILCALVDDSTSPV